MENSVEYGQMNFSLPHDVVKLPTGGIFYTPKKESLKVGYLTAADENIIMSPNNSKDGIVKTLLRNKIYEPGFNIDQLLTADVHAILIFLRNTAFGSDYSFKLTDPKTNLQFEATVLLDEISYIPLKHNPDSNGHFSFQLPKSQKTVKFKLLNLQDEAIIEKITEQYPQGMIAPVVTKRLEMHIVELDGNDDKGQIASFINQMPILDSKELKKYINECEPKLDLNRKIIAPSGEEVSVSVTFGVEFFRPFF